jgi:hypothetical protein
VGLPLVDLAAGFWLLWLPLGLPLALTAGWLPWTSSSVLAASAWLLSGCVDLWLPCGWLARTVALLAAPGGLPLLLVGTVSSCVVGSWEEVVLDWLAAASWLPLGCVDPWLFVAASWLLASLFPGSWLPGRPGSGMVPGLAVPPPHARLWWGRPGTKPDWLPCGWLPSLWLARTVALLRAPGGLPLLLAVVVSSWMVVSWEGGVALGSLLGWFGWLVPRPWTMVSLPFARATLALVFSDLEFISDSGSSSLMTIPSMRSLASASPCLEIRVMAKTGMLLSPPWHSWQWLHRGESKDPALYSLRCSLLLADMFRLVSPRYCLALPLLLGALLPWAASWLLAGAVLLSISLLQVSHVIL